MAETPDYGPRLSGEEYDRRVVKLYRDLPPEPSGAQAREVERREFELTVAYRLGRDFPEDRREALWKVHQRVRRAPLKLVLKSALSHVLPWSRGRDARKLAGHVVEAYGEVLTREELEIYFGEAEVREPGLPVDHER